MAEAGPTDRRRSSTIECPEVAGNAPVAAAAIFAIGGVASAPPGLAGRLKAAIRPGQKRPCKYLYVYTDIDIVCAVKRGTFAAAPTPTGMKRLEFLGSSRDDLCAMPDAVRHDIGLELMRVQFGGEPTNFKPMPTVGAGAYEIRVRDESGAYRTIYVAKSRPLSTCCTLSRKNRNGLRRWTSSLRRSATE